MESPIEVFSNWALNGKDEGMEKNHSASVENMIQYSTKGVDKYKFIDAGCGNGWVVRKMSEKSSCIKAIGIDKSKLMIKNAKSKISSEKESYFVTELESWNTKEKFDIIFSMESLYYSVPMESALKKVFKLLHHLSLKLLLQ